MKITYKKPIFKYNHKKNYVKVSMTFEEAGYIRDYIKSKSRNPIGLLKKGLEHILDEMKIEIK